MTYLQFLLIFLVPPIAALLALERGRIPRALAWQLPVIVAIAVVYTGPWDGALIANGVWSYPPAQVIGRTVLRVPVEEYGFYALQVVLAGTLAGALWRRLEWGGARDGAGEPEGEGPASAPPVAAETPPGRAGSWTPTPPGAS